MLDARHAFSLCDEARLVTGHLTILHTRWMPAKREEADWTDEHFFVRPVWLLDCSSQSEAREIRCAELCGGLHEA